MKALMMTGYGDADSNLAIQDVEEPTLGIDDLLIETNAASLNPIDFRTLRGELKAKKKLQAKKRLRFPFPVGYDVSGVVVAVGSGVAEFGTGDEVFARVAEEDVGTLAERVRANKLHVARKPKRLSHAEAASLPLVGLTSQQALFDTAQLKAGEKVLIHAGSGGIGTLAIQLAKQAGAYVATTTSTKNVEFVRSLGADQVIDYKKRDYLDEVRDFDVIYDTLGGAYTVDAFKAIKRGGRVVSIAGAVDEEAAQGLGLNGFLRFMLRLKARKVTKAANAKDAMYRLVLMSPNGKQLADISQMADDGRLKPVVETIYSFADSIAAFKRLETGRVRGKVVVSMNGTSR